MTTSQRDSFVELYLSRHSEAQQPRPALPAWLSWLLATILTGGGLLTLYVGHPSALLPTWAIALVLAGGGVFAWSTLACSALLTCLGYLLMFWFAPEQVPLAAELLAIGAMVGVIGLLAGRAVHLQQRLRREQSQGDLLRQLCDVWGKTDGSCLKEVDLEGRLQAMNERGMAVMEVCDFDLLRGSDWLGFWQGEWEAPARRAFEQALSGEFSQFSGFCPTAAGTPKWWDVLLLPVRGVDGNVRSILSLSWDVTQLRTGTEALRIANADYEDLLNVIDDGFYRLDRIWRFVQANPRAESLLGQGESLVGKTLPELFPDLPTSEFGDALRDAMEHGFARHFEWHSLRFGGWFRISAYPRADGVSVFFTDITSTVDAVRNLQTTEARLRLTQTIGRFADWTYDLHLQELELSDQAKQLLELNRDQATGSQQAVLLSRIHPDDRLAFVTALLDVTDGARVLDIKLRVPQPASEKLRYFHFAGAVIRPHGQITELLVGSVQDITAQEIRARALVETEAFTRGVIDALPQCIAVLDENGRVMTGNHAWVKATPAATGAPFGLAEGEDYLQFCRSLAATGSAIAQELLEGVEALLEDIGGSLRLEYSLVTQSETKNYQAFAMLMGGTPARVVLVHEDITEAVRLKAALAEQTQRLNLVHEGSNDGIWEWRPADNHLYASDRFVELTGYSPDGHEDFPHWILANAHPEDVEALSTSWSGHLEGRQPLDLEVRLRTGQGWRWFRIRGKAQWIGATLHRVAGALMDITMQRDLFERVQASEARFRDMVEHLPHVFWEYDVATSRLTYLSPALERVLGLSPEAVYEQQDAWLRLVHPEDRGIAEQFKHQSLVENQAALAEFRAVTPGGDEIWIRDRAFPFSDAEGNVVRMVGIAENITEARTFEKKLFETAYFDRVTGLPNRDLFLQRLEQQCQLARTEESSFLILSIVVSRIKWVQKVLGQDAKNDLMQRLSVCFGKALQGRGYLARLGSDQYGVLLCRRDELAETDAVIEGLLASLCDPFELAGEALTINAFIGVARYQDDGREADALLKHGQAAAYSIAQSGRSGHAYFHPSLLEQDLDTLRLESGLERALDRSEFTLYFQPKIGLHDKRVCGAEALIRWNHPTYGLISPLRFVPLLEETGLIVPVGLWCIEQAVAQLAQWQARGLVDFVVAVNVSVRQLRPEFVGQVKQAIALHEIRPHCLELELTESIMHADETAVEVVNQLKKLGVRIAVDDFGTGYATLGSLRSFVPDVVKIDKSFLQNLVGEPADQAIVRSVIDMGHALGMTVVAEGVETQEQCAFLEQLRCDQIQGYLIAPPIEAQSFSERFVDNYEGAVSWWLDSDQPVR
ncbi:EAL domain-containing protein [Stutzerimonas zhaodongensis]|uniref:EAL domain-containing protein n=1 Tax=Stutzerimonas TaxID=2901164 RepID=UPI00388E9A3B